MFNHQSIQVPTLLVDEVRCRRNIDFMMQRAGATGTALRPHFKTHQSRTIGNWMREAGVDRIACSSFRMAEYFAADGWNDITVAFPVNIREADRINRLARSLELTILIDDARVIASLNKSLKQTVDVMIEVDVGSGRSGIPVESADDIEMCIEQLNKTRLMKWTGFLTHAGHTYNARGIAEIQSMHHAATSKIAGLKDLLGWSDASAYISYGDTPGCARGDSNWNLIDEMRPGNYVFFDLMQAQIGACEKDDIAVAMICPVVSVHPASDKVVLYGGGIHFSREHIMLDGDKDSKVYGELVVLEGNSWKLTDATCFIRSLSQEHGIVDMPKSMIDTVVPGDLLGFLPVHSCMTAQCMGAYWSSSGDIIDHAGIR